MDPVIGVDTDEVSIEGGMMDLGKWHAIRHHGLTVERMPVDHVEQQWLGQSGARASSVVRRNHSLSER